KVVAAPAPGDKSRPHGKLRGETNLHGALRLAFRVTTGKPLGVGEYLDLSHTACDSVYLLSDGEPSTDDFNAPDKRDPDEQVVKDRETNMPVAPTPTVICAGPYGRSGTEFASFDFITDDV